MLSVWFVSPAYGRYDTVKVALAQRRHACQQLRKQGIAADGVIVADDDNLATARRYGFHAVEQSNADVGDKFNAGFRYALEHGADHVVYLGSDNWAHPDLAARLPSPRQVMTGSLLQVVDVPTGRMRLCRIDTVYGVIPWIIPRQLLERCGGAPIETGLQRGFDGALIRGLTRGNGFPPSFIRHDPHPCARVDFKTAANLTSFERLAGHGIADTCPPWEDLAAFYPARLVSLARRLAAA